MSTQDYTIKVSSSFDRTDEKHDYEVVFRRWLVREIEVGKMTPTEAVKEFNFHPDSGRQLIAVWREKYASGMVLSLPEMTAEEKQKILDLQKRNKELEKALADANMKNIAINMLIDVAEEKLKINIRKKPGAKQ